MRTHSLILLVALLGATARAEQGREFVFPAAPLFTSVSPVVFPGPGGAVALNASSLVGTKAKQLTFVNSIPLDSANYGVQASYAYRSKSFGISGGYVGTVGGSDPHGYMAGFAAGVSKFSFGVGVHKAPGTSGTPSADASLTLPVMDAMALTTVFRDLAVSPQPTLGLGVRVEGFQLEFFLDLPPIKSPAVGNSAGAAMSFSLGAVSVHGAAKQQTVTGVYSYSGGLGFLLSGNIHLSVEYDDQNRINAGVTLGL
jgi:hypothetical protein